MANSGTDWKPPVPLFLGLSPLVIPPPPRAEIERITGKLHLSTFCRQEALREYEAALQGEDYIFRTPKTDADGYLLPCQWPPVTGSGKTSGRPV